MSILNLYAIFNHFDATVICRPEPSPYFVLSQQRPSICAKTKSPQVLTPSDESIPFTSTPEKPHAAYEHMINSNSPQMQ